MDQNTENLVNFARRTLEILEMNLEWDSDTTGDIARVAIDLGLAEIQTKDGMFRRRGPSPPPKEGEEREFEVVINRTAYSSKTVRVLAKDRYEAQRKAAESAPNEDFSDCEDDSNYTAEALEDT